MIRSAKRKFERRLANGGKEDATKRKKQFFAYVKRKTNSRQPVGPLKDERGQVLREDGEMAKEINRYFCTVFTREDQTKVPELEEDNVRERLNYVNITARKVLRKIRDLRTGAAAGPDQIGLTILKELKDQIAEPLAAIMRKTLDDGQVPEDWKSANVTPIFKSGAKSSPANYRPVSLTSVTCKMMEQILKDDIVGHLERSKLIRRSQHGFMRGRSCVSNLLSFFEKITKWVDGGDPVDVVFLDLAKAFDKVPRERLLRKIEAHGIGGRLLRWIRNWLTGRQMRVVLNGEVSDWAEVLSGVPQGSVLGPLLFIVFMNDLDNSTGLVEALGKFADDTKIGQPVRSEDDRRILQDALDSLVDWMEKWGMALNVKKCKVMHLGRRNPEFAYRMMGQELKKAESEKDLGVMVSQSLKPKEHCEKAARTAGRVLNQILKTFLYRDKRTYIGLYKQYVRPHLEFSSPVWNPWLVGDIELLEGVQKKAVRQVCGLGGMDYNSQLKECNLTSLSERRHQTDMAEVYKILTDQNYLDRSDFFELIGPNDRLTRNRVDPMNMRMGFSRLDIRMNFFSQRVIEHWNKIPADLKIAGSVKKFKKGYKEFRKNNGHI